MVDKNSGDRIWLAGSTLLMTIVAIVMVKVNLLSSEIVIVIFCCGVSFSSFYFHPLRRRSFWRTESYICFVTIFFVTIVAISEVIIAPKNELEVNIVTAMILTSIFFGLPLIIILNVTYFATKFFGDPDG